MAIYQKQHFHTGPDGAAGILFRTGNFPRSTVFRDLFESSLFKLNSGDSATEVQAGHARIETDVRAIARSVPLGDNWCRFVLSHQLPTVLATPSVNHTLISSDEYGDLAVDIFNYAYPVTGQIRRDYGIRSRLSFVSTDGTIGITPDGAGEYDFSVLTAGDTYMVMLDGTDPTPDYIGNKLDSTLYVTPLMLLGVQHIDSNTVNLQTAPGGLVASVLYQDTHSIDLGDNVLGLYANLRLADGSLSVNASGVRVTYPVTNIISSNGSISPSYNAVTGIWDLILSSSISSSGTNNDIQLTDNIGGFTHINGPISQHFRFDSVNGGIYFGSLYPITGRSGLGSLTTGYYQDNGGAWSLMCGRYSSNSGHYSMVYGEGAINDLACAFTRGFSDVTGGDPAEILGKYQEGSFPMRIQTSDANLTQMELMDGTLVISVLDNTAWRVEVDVIANEEGEAISAIWAKLTFGLRRHDGNLEFIGAPVVTGVTPTDTDFLSDPEINVEIPFGPVTDSFVIRVQGIAATTINWGAIVRYISIATGEPNGSSSVL